MLVVFAQFRLILSRRRMFNSKLVAPIRAVASVAALINPGTSTRRYCRPVVPPPPRPVLLSLLLNAILQCVMVVTCILLNIH